MVVTRTSRVPRPRTADNQEQGFTLLELIISMMLLALMSSLLFGTLSLSANSWDRGEAKAAQVSDMRLTEEFRLIYREVWESLRSEVDKAREKGASNVA